MRDISNFTKSYSQLYFFDFRLIALLYTLFQICVRYDSYKIMAVLLTADPNTLIIFMAKGFRNFSYGSLAVPIILYLELIGINH